MSERAPAAPFHARVLAELARQGKNKNWLHQRSGVARGTIDAWEKQPRPPQAGTVAAVADVLGIDREEAASLAGLPGGSLKGATIDLSEVSDNDLIEEVRRRMKR